MFGLPNLDESWVPGAPFPVSTDPEVTAETLAWIVSLTPLPVVAKGLLEPADAVACAAVGVRGVVVSNHGARQVGGQVPAIEALPAIVHALEGTCVAESFFFFFLKKTFI
jgi:isopentenyl diphosphate isomerase/L-lactate dehydrogenase-like FMN-dependent dehydrogenase